MNPVYQEPLRIDSIAVTKRFETSRLAPSSRELRASAASSDWASIERSVPSRCSSLSSPATWRAAFDALFDRTFEQVERRFEPFQCGVSWYRHPRLIRSVPVTPPRPTRRHFAQIQILRIILRTTDYDAEIRQCPKNSSMVRQFDPQIRTTYRLD